MTGMFRGKLESAVDGESGYTALQTSSLLGHLECVHALLEAGAAPDHRKLCLSLVRI